jgi:predicted metal-binding protein
MKTGKVDFTELIELARWLGASDAAVIPAEDISVEDDLAKMCHDLPCDSYGLSASCPPHVAGPSGFRELLRGYRQALVFKIEVPTELLFSHERQEIFGLLHKIAADVEQLAVQKGYRKSKGYAGGSCKKLFCRDRRACQVVSEGKECLNPGHARPSMSGFGINVSKLMRCAGWTMNRLGSEADKGKTSGTGTLCGLVLLG